jgi:hypothetical protein
MYGRNFESAWKKWEIPRRFSRKASREKGIEMGRYN